MVRRYAKCLTDTNTTLQRLNASSASGAIAWSSGAGELTMAEIRADYVRYCKWERGGAAGRARVKGARAVVQSGIKNGLEGLDALRRVMATEYVAWGMNRVGWMTNRVWIMRHIRNREGSKRADEIRHRAGGRNSRTKRFT